MTQKKLNPVCRYCLRPVSRPDCRDGSRALPFCPVCEERRGEVYVVAPPEPQVVRAGHLLSGKKVIA